MFGRESFPLFIGLEQPYEDKPGYPEQLICINDGWTSQHPLLEKLTALSELPFIGTKPPVSWIASFARWGIEFLNANPNEDINLKYLD